MLCYNPSVPKQPQILHETAAAAVVMSAHADLESERYFMAMITLHNTSLPEVTILSNTFIDNYMPEANGEFVKVYIYLLRALSSAPVSFSLEQMADRLLCTERDILRALKYWAKQQLLTLDFTDNNKLCGIALLTPESPVNKVQEEISVTSEQPAVQPVIRTEALTPDRVNELKQNEDIIQLLYVAEQYLGKTLSPTEIQKILFFYDGLESHLVFIRLRFSSSRTVRISKFSSVINSKALGRRRHHFCRRSQAVRFPVQQGLFFHP